jgi:hypothetical protein
MTVWPRKPDLLLEVADALEQRGVGSVHALLQSPPAFFEGLDAMLP